MALTQKEANQHIEILNNVAAGIREEFAARRKENRVNTNFAVEERRLLNLEDQEMELRIMKLLGQ